MNNQYTDSIFSRKFEYIGIPVIGILLSFILGSGFKLFTIEHLVKIIISIAATTVYWISCMNIVIYMWRKYPWHLNARKHLIIEFLLISLVLLVLLSASYIYYRYWDKVSMLRIKYEIVITVLVTFLITLFHEALFFYEQWQVNFRKSAILEKSNTVAKYETLKNQVNPHFLFNGLNTLISLVDDNKNATEYIENMADFLRYTLNSDQKQIKPVCEEINLVKKYFFLQKIRFEKSIYLDIDVDEKYKKHYLPTLSLQMLIENAIKHNIISNENPLKIKIFTRSNYIVVENNLQRKTVTETTKQGLINIKERYKFLSAKNVKITETDDKFLVELPLLKYTNHEDIDY